MALVDDGQQRLSAHRRPIGRVELADGNFAHAAEALRHDFHVGLHDSFAEPSELLDVLLVDDLVELLLRDAEFLQEWRHREERAEERVALHAQLKVATVGRLSRDVEARQREDADVLVDDLLARPRAAAAPTPVRLPLPTPTPEEPPSCMPSSGLQWVKAFGSQHSTTFA